MIVRSVRLAEEARRDMGRLRAFLARHSERSATRAAAAIARGVLSLSEFSERGHPVRHLPGWRELIVRFGRSGYVIRYKVEGEAVFVARIFHGREDR